MPSCAEPTGSTDPQDWERYLKALAEEDPDSRILIGEASLFDGGLFVELDEVARAVNDRISGYGGNDVSSGFPNSLDQLGQLIQQILDDFPDRMFAVCIRTSCSTNDPKVVLYSPRKDDKRYHFNLRGVGLRNLHSLYRLLERRFPNISIRESL